MTLSSLPAKIIIIFAPGSGLMIQSKENIKFFPNRSEMRYHAMEVSTLRQLWSLIEKTQTNTLLQLSDPDLVEWLLGQIEKRKSLSLEENNILTTYIRSKSSLIRDLAEARLV
jgi:succinate dehydrogenase flavin-adding protein (antitoxin of CptAB toxin-antitoxin module)